VATATNWAGNYAYRATAIHEPETLDDLRRIVEAAPRIHALGSRHSFNGIADAAELVSLAKLVQPIEIDREAMTVTVGGGVRYGDLAVALEREGLALHNMASLPHITVAGTIATATHGSGVRNGNLATAVTALELVTSSGDMLRVGRGDADFPGMVVHLGALGVVTRVTLQVEPSYQVRQVAYEHLAWDVALEHFDAIMASAGSVSLFTDYGSTVNQVWRKERVTGDDDAPPPQTFHGAAAAPARRHPIAALPADSCTEQLGITGAWLDRMPHFRMDHTPSAGAEIQSEYMVARRHAVGAIRAVRELHAELAPLLMISEIRTTAADDLWLSSAYGEDTACLHFTWRLEPDAVARVLPTLEAALAPFAPRPHWGKVFVATAPELAPRYPRMGDFRDLANRLDPRGAFRNDFLDHHVFA
jgi:xylitol oxidase